MSSATNPRVIVVGTDYSEASELALQQAFELATLDPNTELHVIHVMRAAMAPYIVLGATATSEARDTLIKNTAQKLDDFLASHPDRKPPARVVCHVRVDEPAHEIAQLAADLSADLIVVGTHGRRAAARVLIGSVAEVVVRLAPCPVLVARPKAIPEPAPRIEPPCPRCVETRQLSGGEQYWCEQHLERHGQRHTYYQRDRLSAPSNFPLVYTP